MEKIFIGSAWPYVNGDLHVGHLAGYLLPADIFARFKRLLGSRVLMVSGSDCFGTPITLEAEKRKISPEDIVREYHKKDLELFKKISISFDWYTKTASEIHIQTVQEIFLRLLAHGYIFKAKQNQYYSLSESKFLPDRYVEGKCSHCGFEKARGDQCDFCGRVLGEKELLEPKSKQTGTPVVFRESEHYFLDWRKLQPFLEKYISEKSGEWRPWVRSETQGWLKSGLEPRAITRDLDWGVPIPSEKIPENLRIENLENKRFYVWFEAVVGYLSASIEWAKSRGDPFLWKEFWYDAGACHYYFMGKDNLVFHTLFWPGQLYGYDPEIHLPDIPAVNQFLNLEGEKFSKSRGVIVDSDEITKKYGSDPVRFYLASIMPEESDASFSWSDFRKKHNNILIGNLGNFIQRTLVLVSETGFQNKKKIDKAVIEKTKDVFNLAKEHLNRVQFRNYVNDVLALSDFGNKYLSKNEPWKLKKGAEAEKKSAVQITRNSLYLTLGILGLIAPLLPETASKLSSMLGVEFSLWPNGDALQKSLLTAEIKNPRPLFEKI